MRGVRGEVDLHKSVLSIKSLPLSSRRGARGEVHDATLAVKS